MRIFAPTSYQSACHYYRITSPFRFLSKDAPQHDWQAALTDPSGPYDVLYLYGSQPLSNFPEFGSLKRAGVKIVWTVDDSYHDWPSWRHDVPSKEVVGCVDLAAELADLIIVSTPPLADEIGKPAKTLICPNLLDVPAYRLPTPPADDEIIRISWIGSATHKADLDIVDGACCRIKEKWGEKVEFRLFGAGPDRLLRDYWNNGVHFTNWVPLHEYWWHLHNARPHLTLAPLIDCHFNRCKCVVGDTLVPTPCGVKTIRDIVEDRERSVRLENSDQAVHGWYRYEQQPTIRIETENGYAIEGTLTHKMRLKNGEWKSLSAIGVGDELELAPFNITATEYQEVNYPLLRGQRWDGKEFVNDSGVTMMPKIVLDENWGRFIGYVMGDGHVANRTIGISCCKDYPDVVDDVCRLFSAMGVRVNKEPKQTRRRGDDPVEPKGLDVKGNSTHLADIMQYIGVTDANRKKIFAVPEVILRSPKSVVREFLRGLFETDGSVAADSPVVDYCTKSEHLARQIQTLLMGFGIQSRVVPRWNKKYQRNYWHVSLRRQACDLFATEIGFISQGKSARLSALCEKPHSNAYKEWVWSDRVAKVEGGRSADVYDIEVARDHYYLANGLVSHNSNIRVLEAWAMNSACIASSVGEYKLVKDHVDGLVCQTEEDFFWAMDGLIRDRKWRESLAAAGWERVNREWSWQNPAARAKWSGLVEWLDGQ